MEKEKTDISQPQPAQNTETLPVQPTPLYTSSQMPYSNSGSRRGSLRVIAWIVPIILCLMVAFIFITKMATGDTTNVFWKPPKLPVLSQDQVAEYESKYGYDIDYRPNISSSEKIILPIEYDYNDCSNTTCSDAIALYSDASLTKKIEANIFSFEKNNVTVQPLAVNAGNMDSKNQSAGIPKAPIHPNSKDNTVTLGKEGYWDIAETYFLVQRVGKGGEKLTRPKVTLFTVKQDNRLSATNLVTNIDENGAMVVGWNAVEHAEEYYVVKITRSIEFPVDYSVIARTDKTTINFADYTGDKKRLDAYASNKDIFDMTNNASQQNVQLLDSVKSEDSFFDEKTGVSSLANGKYNPAENGLRVTSFGVMAKNGNRTSPIREFDASSLLAGAPISQAFHQSSYQLSQRPKDRDYKDLQATEPVTMADGHTALKQVIFDVDHVVVDVKSDNTYVLKIPFRLQGTQIASTEYLVKRGTYSKDSVRKELEAINKRNMKAQPPTGSSLISYKQQLIETKNLDVKKEKQKEGVRIGETHTTDSQAIPLVKYPVNGSTKLVKFIAANMMLGHLSMDISKYYDDPSISISNAIDEAIAQNPYITVFEQNITNINLKNNILTISIEGLPKDEIDKRQEDLYQQATAIASNIDKNSSDRDKALYINRWLSENAQYDYDAFDLMRKKGITQRKLSAQFPYAWNGLGTAKYGKGVCLSYASAFKAIADQSNLRAIVVTGVVNGSSTRHAWNKVYMDNKWQVVDVTWNDGSNELTKYFGLTDVQAERVQDNDFMVDRFVSDYVAQ